MSKRKNRLNEARRVMEVCTPFGSIVLDRVAENINGVLTGVYACQLEADAREAMARLTKLQSRGRCYISGAIAHHDLKERMTAFDLAACQLEMQGYVPVNPFNNGVPQSEHWTAHMRADIGLLLGCDYIYMLKGWELSKGCKLELDVATSCGIKVLFE